MITGAAACLLHFATCPAWICYVTQQRHREAVVTKLSSSVPMSRTAAGARRSSQRSDVLQEWQLQELILHKRVEAARLEQEQQQILYQQQVLVAFIDSIYTLSVQRNDRLALAHDSAVLPGLRRR